MPERALQRPSSDSVHESFGRGAASSPEWVLTPKSWFHVVGTVVRMCFGGSRGSSLAVTDRHGSLCPVHRHRDSHDFKLRLGAPDPQMYKVRTLSSSTDLTLERRLVRLR